MTEGERYLDFLGKNVDIGIPNFNNPNRLFLINGTVIDVNEDYLTLRIKDGYRKIPYSNIFHIQER